MSNIYKIIDNLDLEQAEANKLKIYLIKNHEMKEELFAALTSSYQTKEVQQSLIKDFFNTIPRQRSVEREITEFWKQLSNAKIMSRLKNNKNDVFNNLKEYVTVEDDYIYLNIGVTVDSNGTLYHNGATTNLEMPSKLMNTLKLVLPKDVYFLGKEQMYGSMVFIRRYYLALIELIEENRHGPNDSAYNGCTITGTPDKVTCYQFSPDGKVKLGDRYQFEDILNNHSNFYLVDAQVLELQKAYTLHFTSPKKERYNEAVKSPGFTTYFMPLWNQEEIFALWSEAFKGKKDSNGKEFSYQTVKGLLNKWGPIPRSVLAKWNDESYQNKFSELVAKVDLEKCIDSINNDGMPKDDSISGKIIHLDVNSSFTNVTYRFATNELASRLIDEYERKTRNNIRNFIVCGRDFPETASFRGHLFEDYSHRKLCKGGSFKVRCLKENDNTVITEKNITERKNNFYTTLEDIHEDCYNRPKSKSNISVDSFVYKDDNALCLYQITISTNHGIKVHGLREIRNSLGKHRVINVYFVVPSMIFENYPFQDYQTVRGKKMKKLPKWIDNITQYALEIDMKGSKPY
ncbi:5574_t:CDS:2 [Funneliformis caledonium]|uniref:5574_t:CDS:1 n=1 Tax=Funneliformis caledonium TaxID=1117310 RepID=A0A9N8VU71_9GLOM|nr:5574_t:CDS:2 [Funneliformis caledonium]